MSECIFCKIVAGEIPCAKIYEDDEILAFLDISPFSQGHALVIPKVHVTRLDECPPEVMAQTAAKLPAIAQAVIEAVGAEAFNVVNNNGRAAGQLVDHLHFHIIPRSAGDGIIKYARQSECPSGRMEELARKIAGQLK